LLEPIKESFSAGLSWSDLIVFSANVALEKAGGITLPFCSGRTDALNGVGSQYLAPRVFGNETDTIEELKQTIKLLGLSVHEYAALVGGTRVLAQAGEYPYFNGTWVPSPGKLDNTFFKTLLSEEWSKFKVPETGKTQYKAVGKDLFMLKIDLMFKVDPELQVAAQDYALDDARFTKDFADAWVKLMNADRFVGPTTTGCQDHHHHHHHHQ
jgi:catalase (peroxidase I)